MKINKKIRNWILGIIAGLTIVGTAADLPFGIRAFRRLEDRTFVGLNVGLINSIDMSNVYGASIGVVNSLNESNVYGASIGVVNSLNESNVYGASIGGINSLDSKSNVYGLSGILNFKIGEGA